MDHVYKSNLSKNIIFEMLLLKSGNCFMAFNSDQKQVIAQ